MVSNSPRNGVVSSPNAVIDQDPRSRSSLRAMASLPPSPWATSRNPLHKPTETLETDTRNVVEFAVEFPFIVLLRCVLTY